MNSLALSPPAQAELDDILRASGVITAMKHVMSRHHLSFSDAQDLVVRRDRILHPEPSLEQQEAEVRARFDALTGGTPTSVRASWDGDSTGWMVILEVVYVEPSVRGRGYLGALRAPGGDFRLFTGQVPPWPEVALAEQLGTDFAGRLGVPFSFDRSDGPTE